MVADPFRDLTDDQVLNRAAEALKQAAMMKPGTIERELTWMKFDAAMRELDMRAYRHVLQALRDRDENASGM